MQNRPRPAIQFCQLIESIIHETKTPIRKEGWCFFSDGLDEMRKDYARLVDTYRKVKKMIVDYEAAREEMPMPPDLSAIIEKSTAESKLLGEDIENLKREVDNIKSELSSQEKSIKEKYESIQAVQRQEAEKERKARSDQFMQVQAEKNRLEAEQKKVGDALKGKNFLQQFKMRKTKKEMRVLKAKIKKADAYIEKMKKSCIEKKVNPALQNLEGQLREQQEKAHRYEESFREKMRVSAIKLQAERDKIEGALIQSEHRLAQYNATVNKEMMNGLMVLKESWLTFFDKLETLKVNEKTAKKMVDKIDKLTKIAGENRNKIKQKFSYVHCPDYPRPLPSESHSAQEIESSESERSDSPMHTPTFFSILSTPPVPVEPVPETLLKIGKRE